MMKLKRAVAFLSAFATMPVLADSIDINLHDEAIRGTYTMQLQNTKGLSAEMGMLYSEDDSTSDSEIMLHGGVLVSGENWSKSGTFDISIGGRAVYAAPEVGDMLSVAFGGRVRFSPAPRFGIGGHIYMAPDITSFMDSDGYEEIGIRVDYQILPQAFVYLGHRTIEIDFDNTTWEMDDEIHIGYKMAF